MRFLRKIDCTEMLYTMSPQIKYNLLFRFYSIFKYYKEWVLKTIKMIVYPMETFKTELDFRVSRNKIKTVCSTPQDGQSEMN